MDSKKEYEMLVLLVSDTHGNLDIINQLVEITNADLVIHAGDLGFYDELSYRRLSSRELLLLVKHSHKGKYTVDKQTDRDTLVEIVKNNKLLGDYSYYLNNIKQFRVPVYAEYGNHKDVAVIKALKTNNAISNLNLLDEDNIYSIYEKEELVFRIFGLGGNFLVSQKLLKQPIAGNASIFSGPLARSYPE